MEFFKLQAMLRKIFSYSIVLTGLLFTLASCTREGVIDETADVTGTWAVTGIRSNIAYDWDGDGYTEYDILSTYDYCERDIVLSLEYGGYGQIRQGCFAPWENIYWDLTGNNLRIDMPGDNLNLYILSLSNYSFRGEDQVYVDGRNFTITYTFSRQ
jgi:hypothetical protein